MKKLIVMVAALCMVATSAYAADWNFYGSARVSTFVTDTDVPSGGSDTKSLAEFLQGNSRIGAKVKVSDELTGGFEYGTGVNVRKLYGEWNFGAGKFLVGQTYTPLNWFGSNQVYDTDTDLLPFGGVYSGRQAMLRLTFGDFKIAAVSPSTAYNGVAGTEEVDIPAIEATYDFKWDNITLSFGAGYNAFEIISGGTGWDVDSWVLAANLATTFGPGYFNANVYGGENAGNLLWIDTGDGSSGRATFDGTEVKDVDNFGFILVLGYKFNDMFKAEAGYGYAEVDLDGATAEDEVASYYIQATVTLAPGVFFVPELGAIDYEESTQNEVLYYGIKWQINF